jgi:hypothetical protein
MAVHKDKQPQQKQQKRERDKAYQYEALRARLWLGFHGGGR